MSCTLTAIVRAAASASFEAKEYREASRVVMSLATSYEWHSECGGFLLRDESRPRCDAINGCSAGCEVLPSVVAEVECGGVMEGWSTGE